MEKNKLVMSIDIGTTKIAVMVGKVYDNGSMTVVAQHCIESQGVRRGMVENVEETVRSIKACLDGIRKEMDISPLRDVVVGIAGRHICSRQNSISVIRPKPNSPITKTEIEELRLQINKTVVSPGQSILHVIPKNYVIDQNVVNDKIEGCVGSHLTANYHIVLGDLSAMETIKLCVERSGLRLKKLVLQPLASADAVLSDEERELGVAMIDIGGGTSDIVVYSKNEIQNTTVVPCGGEVITNDIREICSISYVKAEYIKKKYGTCFCDAASDDTVDFPAIQGHDHRSISCKTLSSIIQDRMEQIIDVLVYKIDECGCDINSIVFTGGGAALKDLPQLIKLKTGIDARIGVPCVKMEQDGAIKKVHPMYSTVIGLVMSEHYEQQSLRNRQRGVLNALLSNVVAKVTEKIDNLFVEKEDRCVIMW